MPAPLHMREASQESSWPPTTTTRAQRRLGMAEPLPAFSFPSQPPSKSSEFTTPLPPRHILNLHPTATPTFRHRRHRRNQAVSSSRTGLPTRSSRHQDETPPPVPEIPTVFKSQYSLSRSQLPSRSVSDVSTCPTLESDSGMTSPVSFRNFGSDSGFGSADLEVKPFQLDLPTADLSSEAADSAEADDEDNADDVDMDEDEDDDDEFWHCMGVSESTLASRKGSLAAGAEDEAAGVDVDAWAKAVEEYSFGQMWGERKSTKASEDSDIYMDLMRFPLPAPGWL